MFKVTLFRQIFIIYAIITVIIAIIIASLASWFIFYDERSNAATTFSKHRIQIFTSYIEHIKDQLGNPPQFELAQALSANTGIAIIYKDNIQKWATGIRHRTRGTTTMHQINPTTKIGWNYGLLIAQQNLPDYQLVIVANFRLFPRKLHNGPFQNRANTQTEDEIEFYDLLLNPIVIFFAIILLSLLLIFFGYRRTMTLVKPIDTILSGVQVFSDGNLKHKIVLGKSIDDLKNLANSINKMAEKLNQQFENQHLLILAMSHELRTPLARFKIALDLPESYENKARMHKSVNYMQKLIGDLLKTERLNHTKTSIELQDIDIIKLTYFLLEQRIEDKNTISFIHTVPKLLVKADKVYLELLLANIVQNAINYGQGKPIEIHAQQITKDNKKVISWEVIDNGSGIDIAFLPNIFEPFSREDKSRQRETGGTGIGMYLCHQIAKTLQCNISVNNRANTSGVIVKIIFATI